MKHWFLLFITALCFGLHCQADPVYDPKTQQLLLQLDDAVRHKQDFRNRLEGQATALKARLNKAVGSGRIALCKELFRNYARCSPDSALAYLRQLEAMAAPDDPDARQYVAIGRAEVLAMMGLFIDATGLLQSVDSRQLTPETRLYYYHICRTIYGWLDEYIEQAGTRQYAQLPTAVLTQAYRDSILTLEQDEASRRVVEADQRLVEGDSQAALQLLRKNLAIAHGDQLAYTYYNMAIAYGEQQQKDSCIAYLAHTALTDMQRGVSEYEALPRLASLLYEMDDVERAYAYLTCALEDSYHCKAQLRNLQVSNVYPIIDHAYKDIQASQNRNKKIVTGILALLLLLLAGMLTSLYRQMKKLRQTRRQLAAANEALTQAYDTLKLTDQMKEEYIARYLNRCRGYLDTLENYRRTIQKLMKNHQFDEMARVLKSDAYIQEEQQRFYADFDSAFLTLFPHFIEQFNALLQPEAAVTPKKGELLGTELRIFALIRLGVTDSAQIAHFLNFSLATIYNYRSKIRGRARCEKSQFEAMVARL